MALLNPLVTPEIVSDPDESSAIAVDPVYWLESCRIPSTSRRLRPAVRIRATLETPCRWPGCADLTLYRSQALCRRHYLRIRGRLGPPHGRATDGRGAPSLEHVGYMGAHDRVRERFGLAPDYRCDLCPAPAAQWALPPSLKSETCPHTGLRYSCDPEDYMPLCASCHSRLDRNNPARPGIVPLPLFTARVATLRPIIRREPWAGEPR